MIYLKDLQTGEVNTFTSRYQVQKHLGMHTQIKLHDLTRKRIIKDRYMISDSMDFNKVRKKTGITRNYIVYDNDTIKHYNCNSAKMC